MVGYMHSIDDLAMQKGQRLAQDRGVGSGSFDLNSRERRLIQCKTTPKVRDHIGLPMVENIQSKAASHFEPFVYRPAFLDCDAKVRRLE